MLETVYSYPSPSPDVKDGFYHLLSVIDAQEAIIYYDSQVFSGDLLLPRLSGPVTKLEIQMQFTMLL